MKTSTRIKKYAAVLAQQEEYLNHIVERIKEIDEMTRLRKSMVCFGGHDEGWVMLRVHARLCLNGIMILSAYKHLKSQEIDMNSIVDLVLKEYPMPGEWIEDVERYAELFVDVLKNLQKSENG